MFISNTVNRQSCCTRTRQPWQTLTLYTENCFTPLTVLCDFLNVGAACLDEAVEVSGRGAVAVCFSVGHCAEMCASTPWLKAVKRELVKLLKVLKMQI